MLKQIGARFPCQVVQLFISVHQLTKNSVFIVP
jgi:hypothetical protein